MKVTVDVRTISVDRYVVEVPEDLTGRDKLDPWDWTDAQAVDRFVRDWMLEVCPDIPLDENVTLVELIRDFDGWSLTEDE